MRAPTTNIFSTLLQWDRLRLYLILRFWAAPACRCAKNGKSAPGSWRLFWRCSAMEHRQLLISTSRSRHRLCGRCWRLGLHSQERKQNRQNSSNRQNGLNRQQIRADSAEKPNLPGFAVYLELKVMCERVTGHICVNSNGAMLRVEICDR